MILHAHTVVPRTWHNLRLFYKSRQLFRDAFADGYRAWVYPFFGSETFIPRNGTNPVRVPREYWTMLPTASRLVMIGAHPRWVEGLLNVRYDGIQLVSPPLGKNVGNFLREIFVEDVYRIGTRSLKGKVVMDIGAYIGDSSIAFARRGATVHAFEPFPEYWTYLADNVRLNGLDGQVVLHKAGLADRDMPADADGIRLVDAIRYLDEHHIERVDILKLDCEGCEYELFKNDWLLTRLQPSEIIMEYHRGGEVFYRFFRERGYAVVWPERVNKVGYMYIAASHDMEHACKGPKTS
mgnify:CR=1 FL=1